MGAPHGRVDDVLGDNLQFAMFGLTHRPQLSERVLGAAPGVSPDDADRLIDQGARRQRRLQLGGESERVREDLRVVHSRGAGLANDSPMLRTAC